MKKIILTALVGIIFLIPLVAADQVNMNISVNGTANLNITVDADDTELREDVWGTSSHSDPRDLVLDDISGLGSNPIEGTEGLEDINQLCESPSLQQYFNTFGNIPPDGFVEYLKGMGYDDEAHINFIWTICQQKYISEHEKGWSEDTEGIEYENVADIIAGAINWLMGNNPFADDYEKEIGSSLDSYFASDNDVRYLMLRINDLQLRVEALENAIEEVAAEEHCEGKLKVLAKYGLKGVTCGDTTYLNHLQSPMTGEDVIFGITPVNGETQEPEETEEYIPEAAMDISPLTLPSKIKAYEAFELEVLVKNVGDAEGTDDITLILPEGWTVDKIVETVTLDVSEATIIEFSITPNDKGGEISVSSSTDFETLAIVKPELIMEFGLSPISEEQLNELSGLADKISNTIKSFLTMNMYTIFVATVSSVLIYSSWNSLEFKPRAYRYKHKARKRR